jgi:hypothetical protein
LDADVNTQLHTWRVPENEFTKDKKVTLRGILCHTAGLTVHGFPGYATNAPVPSLVEVLNGVKPVCGRLFCKRRSGQGSMAHLSRDGGGRLMDNGF